MALVLIHLHKHRIHRSGTIYAKIANGGCNPVSKDCFIFLLDSYLFLNPIVPRRPCTPLSMNEVVHMVSVDHLELNHFVILHLSDLKSFFIHCDQVTNYEFIVRQLMDFRMVFIGELTAIKILNWTHDCTQKPHGLIRRNRKKPTLIRIYFLKNCLSHRVAEKTRKFFAILD